ncbi:MAG: PTPDL family protein [Akkermansiaceae bacterium]|nr:PTPDL family protein [Akkermansiaceae bacterium]
MKHSLYSIFMALALASLSAKADVFVLKNGDKVEGRVVDETDTHYMVEVQVRPTIKSEQKVAKEDVIRIVRPDKGLLEYERLRETMPAPDGLSVAEYKQRIERCTSFIERFPSNSKVRRVIKMRDDLKSEMRKVEAGSRKIGGVFHPPQELRENRYELDARIEALKIQELISNRQHLQALRDYLDFRKDYEPTKANRQLLPDMQQLIHAHTAKAQQLHDTMDRRLEERETGLERMEHNDEQASRRAIERQAAELERRFRAEVAAQVGWVTLHPFSESAIDYTLQFSKTLTRDIERFLSQEQVDGGEIYRDLHRMKEKGADPSEMRDLIRTAQEAGVPDRYLEKFGDVLRKR